jgi:hypothetical protein
MIDVQRAGVFAFWIIGAANEGGDRAESERKAPIVAGGALAWVGVA